MPSKADYEVEPITYCVCSATLTGLNKLVLASDYYLPLDMTLVAVYTVIYVFY